MSTLATDFAQKVDEQWGLAERDFVIQEDLCTLNQDRAVKMLVSELIAAKMFPAFRALQVWLAFDFCLANPNRFTECGDRFFAKLAALRKRVYDSHGQFILELIAECKVLSAAEIPAVH